MLMLKSFFASTAHRSGGLKIISSRIRKDNAFILMYHRILDDIGSEKIFVQPGMYVFRESFRRQMAFLKKHFTPLALGELLERVEKGKSVSGCCAITFDDGWRDNFTCAYPILNELQVPATIFLATGAIGTKRLFWPEELCLYLGRSEVVSARGDFPVLDSFFSRLDLNAEESRFFDDAISELKTWSPSDREALLARMRQICPIVSSERVLMDWDEARQMKTGGLISFGAHTANHVILDQVPADQAEKEIAQSRADIEENLGVSPEVFAYPNGNFTSEVQEIVRRYGFRGAVVTRRGWVGTGTPMLEIPRIGMHEDVSRTIPLFLSRIHLKGF